MQPHARFKQPDGTVSAVEWHPIPEAIWKHLGFGDGQLDSVRAFLAAFGSNNAVADSQGGEEAEQEEAREEEFDLTEFVPDANGFDHELPDGVSTRLRMALRDGRYVPQWGLANRRKVLTTESTIQEQFKKLVDQTKAQLTSR